MICPFCNEPLSVFGLEKSLYHSKVYCENCKVLIEFPLTLREIKKCRCGYTLKQIFEKKFLGCEDCHKTFKEELKVFFENYNLDEIYLLEKVSFRDIRNQIDSLSHSRFKVFLDGYSDFLHSNGDDYKEANILNRINLIEIENKNFAVSIRLRYARSIPTIPYHLDDRNIFFISKIFFNENYIFRKLLKNYSVQFHTQSFYNVLSFSIVLNSKKFLMRYYIGDEDHFRADCIDFLDSYNDDINMSTVQSISKNIITIYEFFQVLDVLLPWQFDYTIGFLNRCPTNIGSGIRLYIRMKTPKKNHWKLLQFFQRNLTFKKLKNFGIRGDRGEGSQIEHFITLGWDLPYLDLKKFQIDFEKKLIVWVYEVLSIYNKL